MVEIDISARIREILDRIARAAARSGRSASDVTLLAVSKTKPLEALVEAAKTGLVTHFGENHVQECQIKIPAFPSEVYPVRWHLIGHLQRNKARKAVGLVDVIESVDSGEIAAALERICAETEKRVEILIEANSSAEESKTGAPLESVPALADFVREKCPHLVLKGLMTIGPLNGGESEVRRAFDSVRELRDRLRSGPDDMPCLSMGMSGDFEWAIEQGSTEVRVGTAIFGHR